MKSQPPVERIELSMDDLERILERAAQGPLSAEDRQTLRQVFLSYFRMTEFVEDERTTIRELRRLLFGPTSEKTEKLLGEDRTSPSPESEEDGDDEGERDAGASPSERDAGASPSERTPESSEDRRPGHGRNGASAYEGAERIPVPHGSLKPGDACLECDKGKVYRLPKPGVIVRIKGEAPLRAQVYELEKLRCNLCGKVFTAEPPAGVGDAKYDPTSAAMIGLLKYGSGFPFNRLEGLEGSLGVPLPASTQWDIIEDAARQLEPVLEELIRMAAQGEVVHNDDTSMRILTLIRENEDRARQARAEGRQDKERTGVFTSGIVSACEGHQIALFFTGRQHAGENLASVLARRDSELDPPKQMCDGISRNLPGELAVIVGNCLVHARRHFVDVLANFPEECRHVIEALREVYRNDAEARKRDLDANDRLAFHQERSGPIMAKLHDWLTRQIQEKLVEPNSGLGKAIAYVLDRWDRLTLFLREPGAPLDNNVCERALKKAILHRKNALFYKTENGARVGDLFMSLIHTAELARANPFEYLTELLRHPEEVARTPAAWMPWNYRETLA